jgi:hypothetical protein
MWSALQSRQVAGVTLAPPYSFRADAMKFSRLVDTYDKPYQNTGVVVRRDQIRSSADTWLRILDFLASTVRPEAAKASPKEFYDITILDRLKK